MSKSSKTEKFIVPVLPLREVIVFPHMVVPLFVGREKSIHALEECVEKKKELFLVAQKQATTVNPGEKDIFQIGTLGTILQILRLPDNTVKVLIEGKRRAKMLKFDDGENMIVAEVEVINEGSEKGVETEALVRSLKATFENYVKLNKRIPPEMLMSVNGIEDPSRLGDVIVAHLNLRFEDKQAVLEITDPTKRLEKLLELMQGEIEILQVERRIRTRVKKQMEKSQKEYYLNEQMQAIQKELGEKDEFKAEIMAIEKQIKSKAMSKEAREKAIKEVKKLKMMSPMSAEATVVRNYIDWLITLPWGEYTEDSNDLGAAEDILNEDHYGLDDVKERLLEYLAVRTLTENSKGQILCFLGPPGVGKTSLAKSISRALNKKFIRASMGGVRDEAEIRGHRRTYVGALPGKIIQSLKKAGSSNPVFLLDEVDKMSMDFRGDPSSALLEVLDPEQNHNFGDHYLEVDYDLSKVMFVLTANSLSGVPRPLLDRMEIINISGYTEIEKFNIAKKYLLPKQMEQHGLKTEDITVDDEALRGVIRLYTREAGVRNMERLIATLCRKVAKKLVDARLEAVKSKKSVTASPIRVRSDDLEELLGPARYLQNKLEENHEVGLTNGLAYTEMGGEMLQIEVSVVPGKGAVKITGKLGDVMQESATTAMSYVRSRAEALGLSPDFYQNIDIHLHVPEGAVPKDGPSAGITMTTAITSALTKIPVKRDVAMTGEVTLRGRVLPIGGLKEKLLAAKISGIKTVIIPKDNVADLKKIPDEIKAGVQIIPVDHVDQVLRVALNLEKPSEFLAKAGVVGEVPAALIEKPTKEKRGATIKH
ncbi:MAG: endopeptidase La [Bdellovibrionales bacterium]|nr:endopeptidase La [Bdellovibrionales bacterium]